MVYTAYDGTGDGGPKCPKCGGTLQQKGSGYKVSLNGINVPISPRRYRWQCSECGTVYRSTERRPLGERRCCAAALSAFRGRQSTRRWRRDDQHPVLKRELSVVCPVCGEVYVWDEIMPLLEVE